MSDGDRAARSPRGRIDRSQLLGVVLAGGKSSRMGQDKATLPCRHDESESGGNLGKCSYLEHAILRLVPLVDRVVVSGRDWPLAGCDEKGFGNVFGNVIGLRDERADLGPAMGVATALRYASRHRLGGVLVTPVDMPGLRSEQLELLIGAWSQRGGVVCASFASGVAEPLLAIYPVTALRGVEQVVSSQRRSLSGWLKTQRVEQIELPAAAGKNVNRPEDR